MEIGNDVKEPVGHIQEHISSLGPIMVIRYRYTSWAVLLSFMFVKYAEEE
jgi:hypothetical protein